MLLTVSSMHMFFARFHVASVAIFFTFPFGPFSNFFTIHGQIPVECWHMISNTCKILALPILPLPSIKLLLKVVVVTLRN
jgi:hypothetical protein